MLVENFDQVPPLRPPSEVMRLRRLGAAFPTRLSFLRVLLRRLGDENAAVERPIWEIDEKGFGHAVYTVSIGGHAYSLVAVSSDLPEEKRTDRVIAEAWDTAYVLYDGIPDAAEIARIVATAPLQEAARFTERDLVLSRANKSVRLFSHVVEALRAGRQPEVESILQTGYLMRTTAVYGNGKFGIADREIIAGRPGLRESFMAEMLSVWLIRGFTHDLVEHLGGAQLDRNLKRYLGIGNSTGLGMAPFLVSHPLLLNAWFSARETALSRVRGVECLEPMQIERLAVLGKRALAHLHDWQVADAIGQSRIDEVRREWPQVLGWLAAPDFADRGGMEWLWKKGRRLSIDGQELLAALMIEPFGALVDELASTMVSETSPCIEPGMACEKLQQLIAKEWNWALRDYSSARESYYFWYVSEAKSEPRLGVRRAEPGAERETPLDVARLVAALDLDLTGEGNVASFLARYPQHRAAVRRVQARAQAPYAEIQDNLIDQDCLPIDMLRSKLAFFGAAKFDPRSDRWTRITLCQGAPLFDELDAPDDWWLPVLEAAS